MCSRCGPAGIPQIGLSQSAGPGSCSRQSGQEPQIKEIFIPPGSNYEPAEGEAPERASRGALCARGGLEGELRKHLGRVDVAVNLPWPPRCLIFPAEPRAKPRLSGAPAGLIFLPIPHFLELSEEASRAGRCGAHPGVFTVETSRAASSRRGTGTSPIRDLGDIFVTIYIYIYFFFIVCFQLDGKIAVWGRFPSFWELLGSF